VARSTRDLALVLAQRLLAAAVGIPIIVAVVLIGGVLYTAVAAIILAMAAFELVAVLSPNDDGHPRWPPAPAGLITAAAVALIAIGADTGFDEWTAAIVAGMGLAFLVSLVREPADGTNDWRSVVAAVAYVGFLGSYLILLRDLDDGTEWVFLAVLATWSADTFAYFTGKLIGRNKMSPRISPGKTWEGTAGGVIGGLLTVILLDLILDLPMSTAEAALLGLLLPPVAVLADLGESMLKRGAGVKDTSELIPGHGGFLDRLDSILFTVPLVYYFAIWVVLD
jgi:phosphatidate cytidylyltransferase